MRVRAGTLEQPVLPREAQRLVVERIAQKSGVVDLEHVDLGQVAMHGRRIRDGVHAIEWVRQVDEPALLADRCDRVGEGHAARDLLLQEEADDLALVVRLHLLARNHDQVAAAGDLDCLERAAEDVVIGDRDATEPDRLGVVDEFLRGNRAVVRPVGVHVEVDGDPVAVGKRIDVGPGPSTAFARESGVDLVELVRDRFEALRLGAAPRSLRLERALLGVASESRDAGDRVLVVAGHDCCAARGGFERQAVLTTWRRNEDRGRSECVESLLKRSCGAHADTTTHRSRDGGSEAEGLRVHECCLPARQLFQEPEQGARGRSTGNLELDGDHISLRRRRERVEVEAERNDGVLALEALACRLRSLRGGRAAARRRVLGGDRGGNASRGTRGVRRRRTWPQ